LFGVWRKVSFGKILFFLHFRKFQNVIHKNLSGQIRFVCFAEFMGVSNFILHLDYCSRINGEVRICNFLFWVYIHDYWLMAPIW
jgi:hypothetical protein